MDTHRLGLIIIFFMFPLWLSGCRGGDEYIGKYVIDTCNYKNGSDCKGTNGSLDLKSNHSFELVFSETILQGTWRFHDTGDVALVELTPAGSNIEYQCVAGGRSTRKYLSVLNPGSLVNDDSLSVFDLVKPLPKV